MNLDPRSALAHFARAYADMRRRGRAELSLAPVASAQRFTVGLIGVIRQEGCIIVSAPRTADHALIAVQKGQGMVGRWVSPSTAFRFGAVIANLAFEPVPLVYLNQINAITYRRVRQLPRALTALSASVRTSTAQPALVVDLSIGGAQIGLSGELDCKVGEELELIVRPRMFGHDHVLTLRSALTLAHGTRDPQHPLIRFYSVHFLDLHESAQLILHAYVQQQLAGESDFLSATLLAEASEVADPEEAARPASA